MSLAIEIRGSESDCGYVCGSGPGPLPVVRVGGYLYQVAWKSPLGGDAHDSDIITAGMGVGSTFGTWRCATYAEHQRLLAAAKATYGPLLRFIYG